MHENVNTMFSGNYYVVTGATQGLGAAVAQLLAERGAAGLMLAVAIRKRGPPRQRSYALPVAMPDSSPLTLPIRQPAATSLPKRKTLSVPCMGWLTAPACPTAVP